jgi:hypothetical protein
LPLCPLTSPSTAPATRRLCLQALPRLALTGLAGGRAARAQAPGMGGLLDENDPGARGVAYHADAQRVDPAKNPAYKPGQRCDNCSLYAGEAGQAQGGCGLFYGKDVAARGWCNAWDKKPA